MARDNGIVFSFAELLFPVRAITAVDGATVTDVILNAENRLRLQSVCRLLCQTKIVAMATTITHSATPTATVTSRRAARTSVVDAISVDFGSLRSLLFNVATSVLHGQHLVMMSAINL